MPPPIAAQVLNRVALEAYRIPSITAYNRLEASPRTADFARSLKAEIRDPLWMLTRQWQFGEFEGEDAASPVSAKIAGTHTRVERVAFPGDDVFAFEADIPLETQVERETVRPNLWLATQMARMVLRSMRDEGLIGHRDRFIGHYPLAYVIDGNDLDALQLRAAVEGVLFDGFALWRDINTTSGSGTAFDVWMTSEGISTTDQNRFREIADLFSAWFARTYSQPVSNRSAWLPSQLEYQFAVGPSQLQQRLTADQYSQGHLDWYSFDVDSGRRPPVSGQPPPNVAENVVSFIPAPISFKGMPNPRFWTFEDAQIDFGRIDTSATGLLHMLLAEFGLIYGNDWFMLPYPLDVNTICRIDGMTVRDVFGQHTLVRAAGRGREEDWQRWAMFRHTDTSASSDANLYYLAPAIGSALDGSPLEQVNFLRDEMANLVWAVETTVPSQSGTGVSGNEMALTDKLPAPFVPVNDKVVIRYVAGTTVPDNWIPFIPVRIEGSVREIRLQRARLPAAKGALGVLLTEKAAPYYINEEEIPRAGVIVQRSFQRTRWFDGRTYLWIGRRKDAGKGEGWSNLRFDRIEDIPENVS